MTPKRMHDHEVPVDEDLVRRLIAEQFPRFTAHELRLVTPWGTDNAIWRLGHDLVVRLPRMEWSKGQPVKEATWLPLLAPYLPVAVPEPMELGAPSEDYPFAWSIHRWLPGTPAHLENIASPIEFAGDLIKVIRGLDRVPVAGAPSAHNRARPLAVYDQATRQAIERAAHLIDADVALAVWEDGLNADPYDGPAQWVHGDLEGNCLVDAGQLSGLVDWGTACVGDPAVDVQVAWSPLFTDESRQFFLDELDVDDATIRRAKAAAINQACGALPYYLDTYPLIVERSWHKLAALGVPALR